MFRALIIAVTLTGMALCQYQCMGAAVIGTRRAKQNGAISVRTCCCCCPATNASEDVGQPRDPDGGEECQCQGVCGGALIGEAISLSQLMLTWGALVQPVVVVPVVDEPAVSVHQLNKGEPSATGAVDGRALRILHASLLT